MGDLMDMPIILDNTGDILTLRLTPEDQARAQNGELSTTFGIKEQKYYCKRMTCWIDKELGIYNASEVWLRENSCSSIPSFSQSLDKLLGNHGLPLCSFTEVIGLPGTGKTQLCLQLCASVQIPTVLGGLSAEALYIDTNTGFTIERFQDILSATLHNCCEMLGQTFPLKQDDAMKKLHYVNAFGLEKFMAFMCALPKFIEEHGNIRLIVLDSITYPFKASVPATQRTGILFRLMAQLQKLATEKNIAVVITNEMSTRVGLSSGCIVGALGDAWAHRCTSRLLLAHDHGSRHAVLVKSNTLPRSVASFRITEEGIRDVE